MEKHIRKKSADGIRVRPAGKAVIKKQPESTGFPIKPGMTIERDHVSSKKEELVIHTYSAPVVHEIEPSSMVQSSPEEISTNRGAWFAFPKKTIKETEGPTFSERITLPRHPLGKFALWGMTAGLVVIIGSAVLLSTILSRATVRVKAKVEVAEIQNVSVIFDASASQSVPEQKIIPAEHLHFTQTSSQEVAVSSTKYSEERAGGIVKISNRYNTTPQALVVRTRFLTPSGVLFRLVSPVVIPGAIREKGALAPSSIDAQLVADVPGEQANISGEVQLKIPGLKGTPKYDGFTVIAFKGFSGGSRGTKKVASDADTQSAQQAATKKVYDDLKQQMQQKIPPGLRMIDGLQEIRIVKVALESLDPHGEETLATGAQKDKLAVRATADADALVFREDDVVALLKNVLLPQDGSKILIDNSVNLTYAVQTLNFDHGRAQGTVQGSVKTKQPLTQSQRDDLTRALAGKKLGSVREFFNSRNDSILLSAVSVFPAWKSTLPADPRHIEIVEEGTE